LSISEKNDKGFKVLISETSTTVNKISFDWIAMAKSVTEENDVNNSISTDIKEKLEVPESEKAKIVNFYMNFKPTIDIKK
jgi:hypothetical protein